MFLKKLFQKSSIELTAKLYISNNPSFEIITKTAVVTDKELILLSLLIYARILRVENSRDDRKKLIDMFNEFHTNYKNVDNKEEFLVSMLTIFSLIAKPKKFEDTATVKLKKGVRNLYLDMTVIKVYPISSVVYTIFILAWKLLDETNRIHLLEAFTLLGNIYLQKPFTLSSAVDIPNMIVYEIICKEQ